MELIVRCMILSFLLGTSCKLFFETLLPRRILHFPWLNHLLLPSFMTGFLLISFTPIPPYAFQPVRFVFVVTLIVLIYFQAGVIRSLTFSILLCSIYWIVSAFFAAVLSLFPTFAHESLMGFMEYIIDSLFLCLMLVFYYRFKRHAGKWLHTRWTLLGFFPLLSIITIIAIIMMDENGIAAKSYATLTAVSAFAAINVCFFYFVIKTLEKEDEIQQLRLIHERTQNQMNLYRSIQKNYELQRRQLHDYKNQLGCIQGMLQEGQLGNALSYISKLTGPLMQNTNLINTNHDVVNIMLNRKYQEACEKGITMTLSVNDLSGLAINEEDIVILLGNLLDNAISACEKLDSNKIIQFKMTFENDQLILSVRNPVKKPVQIKENKVILPKKPVSGHGIGLLNVDSVIQKHAGTSILACENGWFYFSAIIP